MTEETQSGSKAQSPNQVRGVLFDLGGTLLDYHREEVFQALLKEQGVEVTAEQVTQAYEAVEPVWNKLYAHLPDEQRWTDETFRQLDLMVIEQLQPQSDKTKLASYVADNWFRVDQELPQVLVRRPYPDVLPCLEKVRELELKTGIVSNIESEDHLRKELEGMGLLGFFPVLVASGSVGTAKPAREIFEMAANRLHLRPRETLFVGDDLERDYQGALRAGLKAVLLDRNERYGGQAGINRVSSLDQLPRLLIQTT